MQEANMKSYGALLVMYMQLAAYYPCVPKTIRGQSIQY